MARNKYDVDESLETPFDFGHLKRSLVYVKRHTKKMALALILSAISMILTLFSPLFMQRAFDVSVPNKDIPELIVLSLLIAFTIVGSVVLYQIRAKIMNRVGNDIIYDIRTDLYDHLQKLPFQYYDDRPHGKILVRVVHYVNAVSDMLTNGIVNFILEIFNLIFIGIFMFFVSSQLSLIILSGVPFLVTIIMIIKPIQRRAWQNQSNKNSNLTAYTNESISGMKITQIFTREEENLRIYHKLCVAAKKAWMNAIHSSNLVWFSVETIAFIVYAAIYIIGLLIIGPSNISFGVFLAMGNYASRFWQPINNLSNIYNSFINGVAYLERIFETMDEPVEVCDAPDAVPLPQIKGDIVFEDVVFGYEKDTPILSHVNFSVKAGESIALVGPTGAGKTTIVNLLSRFYNLTGGRILIDGYDISKVTIASLRSQMGIMLQDSFIFSGTIRDNILYGKLDATDQDIMRACEIVKADDFIKELEDGLDTEVNERGSRLSQGQKQLISFARTLISDPKILILDEATSSIDTKTEKLMQESLNRMMQGRTSFIIAHRLSTIRNCDRIMYISDKNVSECGTHEELMAKKGEYYKLYTSQIEPIS